MNKNWVTEAIGKAGFRHGSFFHSKLGFRMFGIREGSNSDTLLFGSELIIVILLKDDITRCIYSRFF